VILYESTHRIVSLLEEIAGIEPTRMVSICRELTKKFEESIRGTVSECLVQVNKDTQSIKGEFVVVIEGNNDK
jgi:16S rRNA (cytidine1402-2'-O)-methyltransferase